jgi:carbon storage regulator
MLVLSRKVGEKLLIGDHIEITVVRLSTNSVRLGVDAPRSFQIVRQEIKDQPLPAELENAPEEDEPSATGSR